MAPRFSKQSLLDSDLHAVFVKATEEAQEKYPNSPAVALGFVITKKLESEEQISPARIINAARLLMPLCRTQKQLAPRKIVLHRGTPSYERSERR